MRKKEKREREEKTDLIEWRKRKKCEKNEGGNLENGLNIKR
jgi:hypothetical protein